jgi:hypothetical protein
MGRLMLYIVVHLKMYSLVKEMYVPYVLLDWEEWISC